MDLQITPYLLLASFFLLLTLIYRKTKNPNHNLPPGPMKLPFIGDLHRLAFAAFPHHTFRALAHRHGRHLMFLRLGQIDTVVASSREAALEIMKTQDLNFVYRPPLTAAAVLAYDCTDIAFSPYSAYWRMLRKLCMVELLSPKRVRSFASLRADETMNMLKIIASRPPGEAVDLSELLIELTNSIVSRASFGTRAVDAHKFYGSVKEGIELASGFCVADLFPSLKVVDVVSGMRSKCERIFAEIDEMLEFAIKEHQMRSGEEEDLVDILLKCKDRSDLDVPLTIDNIKAVIMDMFTAGTDTSAATLTWAMSELIRKPEAMEKAQKQVREAMNAKIKTNEIDCSELEYIKAIIKETLRLHPPAPLLVPRVAKETCQILGYTIPAGTRIVTNAWAIQRDPRYWDDAESFKPERFVGSSIDYKGSNFEFVPFGAGRRICPGMTFASATLEFTLVHLLFYFDWNLPFGMKVEDLDMTETFGATVFKKTKLQLVATPHYPLPIM